MKRIFFTAALALFAVIGAGAQTSQDVSAKYDEGVAKGTARDMAGAIAAFEEVVTMGATVGTEADAVVKLAKETLPQLYFQNGGRLFTTGNFTDALTMFEKAVVLAKEMGNARVEGSATTWIGNTYLKAGEAPFNAGNFAEAAEIYARAHEAQPANVQLTTRLAESYGRMKEYDKAYALFEELADGSSVAETAKSRLAFYMMLNADEIKGSDPAGAIDILGRAVEVEPSPVAYMLLLVTANGSRNYDKVIEFGERAAEAQTDAVQKSNAYSLLGAAYQQKDNNPKAIEAFRKVTTGPNAAGAKATITAIEAEMAN